MKRRLIALLLVTVSLANMLAGCGKKDGPSDTSGSTEIFTNGMLLAMVCDVFGMMGEPEAVPYLASVPVEDPYFTAVQFCAQWDIIDKERQDYDVDAEVTRGELAVVAVNAGELAEEGMDDSAKIELAASMGIVEAENGKVKADEKVDRREAANSLAIAQQLWANPQYEPMEEHTFTEGIADYTEQTNTYVMDTVTNTTLMTGGTALQPGDIYIVKDAYGFETAHRVGSVEETENGTVVMNDDTGLTFEDVFEELSFQATAPVDLTSGTIEDGNGNMIHAASGAVQTGCLLENGEDAPRAYLLGQLPQTASAEQTAFIKATLNFTTNGVTVKGNITNDSVSFKVSYKLNSAMTVSQSYEISDFNLSSKIDYGILRGLKYARLQLSYETESKTTFETKLSANNWKDADKQTLGDFGHPGDLSNLIGKIAYDSSDSAAGWNYDGKEAVGCSKSIGIAKIHTPLSIGVADIVIEIKLEFTVKGTVELVVTSNTTNGIEYKKGSGIRVVKEKSVDKDFKLKASFEGMLYVGAVANALGFNVADVGVKIGAGVSGSATVHLADYTVAGELAIEKDTVSNKLPADFLEVVAQTRLASNLKIETCTDLKVYFILRITAGDNSLLGKFAKVKIEIFGEKNPLFNLSWHWEDGEIVEKCTRKYRTDEDEDTEDAQDEEKEDTSSDDEEKTVNLKTYVLRMSTEPKRLELEVPSGETAPEVLWTSDNISVATVDGSGLITPVSAGTAIITVSLKSDPKVHMRCVVYVTETQKNDWVFLPSDMAQRFM